MNRNNFTKTAKKALALALSVLMVTSGVPAAAIAEALDEATQANSSVLAQDGALYDDELQSEAKVEPETGLKEAENTTEMATPADDDLTPVTLDENATLTDAPELTADELTLLADTMPVVTQDLAADEAPTYADGTSIDSMSVNWITKDSDGADDGIASNLNYVPDGDGGFEARMNVRFALSGTNDYEPGTIRLTIPKYTVKTRDGEPVGSMTLSVPEAPSSRASFAYYETDDSYVLVNMVKLAAATPVLLEFTQRDIVPHEIVGNPQTKIEGISPATFDAILEVTTPQGTVLSRSGSITATFDTAEKFSSRGGSMYAQTNTVYNSWSGSWPAELAPDNPENYVFIDWYAYKYAEGNQAFTSDVTFELLGENPEGAILLGVVGPDGTVTRAGEGQTTVAAGNARTLYQENLTAHAYVAVPRDVANDKLAHSFRGKMTFSITPVDDQETVTSSLTASMTYQLKDLDLYRKPQREFYLQKNGNNYLEGALDKLAAGQNVTAPYSVSAYLCPGADIRETQYADVEDFAYEQVAEGTTLSSTLTDDAMGLGGLSSLLEADEYEYQYVDLTSMPTAYKLVQTTKDGYALVTPRTSKQVAAGSWVYERLDRANAPLLSVEARRQGGEWEQVATVDYSSGAAVIARVATDVTANGGRLAFDAGSSYVGVRVSVSGWARQTDAEGNEVTVGGYYVAFSPALRLKGTSESLRAKVDALFAKSSTPSANLHNSVRGASAVDERQLWTGSASAYDTLTGGASLKVTPAQEASFERNEVSRCYDVTYTMTVHERTGFRNKANYEAAIEEGSVSAETSGTFYDLLPLGVYPDVSSIALREGDKVESVRVERNYKGTGRTLVVVGATLKQRPVYYDLRNGEKGYEDVPTLTLKATYGYDDAAELGDNPTNVMAFESANDALGAIDGYRGENNNYVASGYTGYNNRETAAAVDGLEYALCGLNPDSQKDTFVYSRNDGPVPYVDRAYVSTWSVTASANGDGQFDRGIDEPVNVYDGGAYSYQLRTVNAEESGVLKGIVMYDKLEVSDPVAPNAGDTTWQGTFAGVDVSALWAIGVEPVVYYCTDASVDLGENGSGLDLSNGVLWTTEVPADLASVKAVAIDASRTTDGDEFALGQGKTLSAIINMRAPRVAELAGEDEDPASYYDSDEEPESGLAGGAHAYNAGVVVSSRPNGDIIWAESGQTKVGLAEYLLTISKEWDDRDNADGFRPSELAATLVANGVATDITAKLNNENNWQATLEGVPTADEKGEPIHYAVAESAAEGDGRLSAYYASQTEDVTSAKSPHYAVMDAFAIKNFHDPDVTTVSGRKVWDDARDLAGKRPSSIKVNLYADGKLSQSQTVRPDADGEWTYSFADLPVNRAANTPITYTIDEDYVPGYATTYDAEGTITNSYDPYGILYVSQTLENATAACLSRDPGFTFRLDVTREDGSPDGESYSYVILDANGNEAGQTGFLATGEALTLKRDQTVRFDNIPSETTYKVTQVDDAGCALTSTSGETGQIRSGADRACHAAFVNTYASKGTADVSAVKVLEGATLAAGQYTFQMYDENGVLTRTGFNANDGTVLFGKLRYTEADDGQTYHYTIRERKGTRGGVTYSEGEIEVTVTVADNGDGTMRTNVTYSGGDGTAEEQAASADPKKLVNSYASSGEVTLTAWKTLQNGELGDGDFDFTLEAETEGAPMPAETTARNDESGTITFGPIAFTGEEAGQPYTYVMREVVDPSDTATVYDKGYFKFTITPKDNGDGTLSFDQSVVRVEADGSMSDVSTPVFGNKAADGSLRVEKYVKNGDASQEFTFWLQLTGNDGEDLPSSISPTLSQVKASDAPDVSGTASQTASAEDANGGLLDTLAGWGRGLLGLFTPEVAEAETIEGTLGTFDGAATYTYDTDTRTVIVHEGRVASTGSQGVSYFNSADGKMKASGIKKIIFEEGSVISRGDYLFRVFTSLESVEGVPTITTTSFYNMFYYCKQLNDISGLSNWDVSSVKTFESMFSSCDSLADITPLSNWKTSKVTNMFRMFQGCKSLASVPTLNWDVSAVTNMREIFVNCSNLESIDGLGGWNTEALVNFQAAFYGCTSLSDISGIANWDVSNITNMSGVFTNCKNLASVEALGSYKTTSLKDISSAFYGCSKLTNLVGLENWDVSSVTAFGSVFSYCSSLNDISALSNWSTSSSTSFSSMFSNCTSLQDVSPLGNWDTKFAKSFSGLFDGCSKLTSIAPLSAWDTSSANNMERIFRYCSSLTDLAPIASWDISHVTSLAGSFMGCTSISSLMPLAGWDTGAVQNLGETFRGCERITSLQGLERWNVTKVKDMASVFSTCSALTDLAYVSNWDTSALSSFKSAFSGCKSLKNIDGLKDWDTSKVTAFDSLFSECASLKSLEALSTWNVAAVTSMNSCFSGCGSLASLNGLQEWKTSSLTTLSSAFRYGKALVDITALESWDVVSLKSVNAIFSGCSSLADVSALANWDTRSLTDMMSMFYDCAELRSAAFLGKWNLSSLNSLSYAFSGCSKLIEIEYPNSLKDYAESHSNTNSSSASSPWCGFTPRCYSGNGYTEMWVQVKDEIESSDVVLSSEQIVKFIYDNREDLPIHLVRQRAETASCVRFYSVGGSGYMSNHVWVRTVNGANAGTTLPKNSFYWFDHEFLGWNTAINGTGDWYADGAIIAADDENFPAGSTRTLYAQWKINDHTTAKTERGYKITLGGNQAATITGLPAGVGYQLYEETSAGWVLVGSKGASGTIKAGQQVTAAFVNSYQPKKAVVQIQASKTLDGGTPGEGAYSFNLFSADGTSEPLQTVKNSAGGGVTFGSIEYTETGTYKYVMREVTGDDATVSYDGSTHYVDITVTDEGGVLAASVKYDGGDIPPTFKNSTKRAALTVNKKVTGTADASKEFTFQVKLGQSAPQTIKLHAGESQTFNNLQVGTAYSVTETDIPSGYSTSQASYDGSIEVGGSVVTVTNTYSRSAATVGITAKKVLEGATLENGQFKFGLFEVGAPADSEPLAVAYNDAQGDVTFSPVSVAADKNLEVRELAEATNDDVSYDASASRQVHVVVADNGDGTQTALQQGEAPVFTNAMKKGVLRVTNTLQDTTAASRNAEFTYTLTVADESGNALSDLQLVVNGVTTVISSGGSFSLGDGQSAEVTLPSRARYTVTQGSSEGFQTVASGSSGTLDLRQVDEAKASFVNTYSATGSFTPSVTKVLKGEELEAGQFAFELRDADGAFVASATNAADGSVEFPQVVFDQADFVDKTTEQLAYSVQEVSAGRDDLLYDNEPVNIAVTVTDDGKGHLAAVASYSKVTADGEVTGGDASTITNSRSVVLPRTGRDGIVGGVAAGLALVLAGCAALLRRRRRQK